MSFSTYGFIFLFFPVMLMLYYGVGCLIKAGNSKCSIQTNILIIGSFLFLAMSGVQAVICIAVSGLLNYVLVQALRARKGNAPLYIGIAVNVLLLGYFKYYNFFIDNVNAMFSFNLSLKTIVLPAGISFYTFQQILFLVEYSKSEREPVALGQYVLGVVFFAKVASGPIVPYQDLHSQWAVACRRFDAWDVCAGIYLFCIGLFKKIVLADTLNYFVSNGYSIADKINFWQAWCVSLCYTMQIYFDFSGYSDMAVGIAKTFGIELPVNFDSPYRAKSITEFWRKWHITLSKALSALIYIPMGGSRRGIVRTCINLLATFMVSGLWHGASWTFVFWGTFHGIIMILERIGKDAINRAPVLIRRVAVFLIVNLLWVLFRANDLKQAFQIYRAMASPSLKGDALQSLSVLANDGIIPFPDVLWSLYLLVTIACLMGIIAYKKNSNDLFREFAPNYKTLLFSIVLFVVSVLHLSRVTGFVYVNF